MGRRGYGRQVVVLLLGLLPAIPVQAWDLAALFAFIEEHNHRLRAQRQVLATLAEEPPSGTQVLELLEADRKSWLKYFRLTGGVGGRATPSLEEGSGLDTRVGLTITIPLADRSVALSVARERAQQETQRQARRQQLEAARLAYVTLRDQLFAEAVARLASLSEQAAALASAQAQRDARLEQQPLLVQRVAAGVEGRERLWQLTDQLRELERQIAGQRVKLQQTTLELALYGGEQWKTLWGLLDGTSSWPTSDGR